MSDIERTMNERPHHPFFGIIIYCLAYISPVALKFLNGNFTAAKYSHLSFFPFHLTMVRKHRVMITLV